MKNQTHTPIFDQYKEVKALIDVLKERKRQDELWGEQNHDPFVWLSILTEEVGEFSEAILTAKFENGKVSVIDAREEMVQVAAVAISIIQSLDRNELKKRDWEPKPTLKTLKTFKFRFLKPNSSFEREIEARTLADAWKEAHDIESANPTIIGIADITPTNTHTNADNSKSNNEPLRDQDVAKNKGSDSGDSGGKPDDCGCRSRH